MKTDIQTVIDKLKTDGKEFSYIGLHPVAENAYRLRLKADWFCPTNRWDDLTTVSRTILALTKSGDISKETFFAIRGIDLLESDEEDNNSIPWDIFKLSDEELRRITQLIFHRQTPVNATPTFPYHYELKPAH